MSDKENTSDQVISTGGAGDVPVPDQTDAEKTNGHMKDVFLFLISPFVALAYAAVLPFYGFFQFTKLGHEANRRRRRSRRR